MRSADVPGPVPQCGIGVVSPYDFALDRELWRWLPDDVSLYLTRTPDLGMDVTVQMASLVGDEEVVAHSTADLVAAAPDAVIYACTSGSFVRGSAGEATLVKAMMAAGAPKALTTSGAISEALAALAVTRVAVATPYDAEITAKLEDYLSECGVQVAATAHLGLSRGIAQVSYAVTADLARRADREEAEAVFLSCTNLPTYDVIAPLERELGKPVITANQVSMWAALQRLGRRGVGPGQWLLQVGEDRS